MKKIICSDLGGPSSCEVEIKGDTPDEIIKNCQEHVMEEVEKGNGAHLEAVENLQGLSPEELQEKTAEYVQVCVDACKRV